MENIEPIRPKKKKQTHRDIITFAAFVLNTKPTCSRPTTLFGLLKTHKCKITVIKNSLSLKASQPQNNELPLTKEAMAQTGQSKRDKLDGLLVTSLVSSSLKLAGYNGMESVWETLENLQMFSVPKAEVIQP